MTPFVSSFSAQRKREEEFIKYQRAEGARLQVYIDNPGTMPAEVRAELMQSLINAGIYDADGNLTEHYR